MRPAGSLIVASIAARPGYHAANRGPNFTVTDTLGRQILHYIFDLKIRGEARQSPALRPTREIT
jgi:hypothetical protein